VRRRRVVIEATAEADIESIGDWISEAGAPVAAYRFIRRVRVHLARYDTASERGQRRDDIEDGVRVAAFERTLIIVFKVYDDRVTILRVFRGSRDWEAILKQEPLGRLPTD
jgi:toxin ParE1/3/4